MGRRCLRPALVLILAASCLAAGRRTSLKEEMRFGVEAAEHGLWREAIFRWEKFLKENPDSARLRNNLAVAYESLGQFDKAEEQYKEARRLDPNNKEIRDNYTSFQELFRIVSQRRAASGPAAAAPALPAPAPSPTGGAPGAPEGSPAATPDGG